MNKSVILSQAREIIRNAKFYKGFVVIWNEGDGSDPSSHRTTYQHKSNYKKLNNTEGWAFDSKKDLFKFYIEDLKYNLSVENLKDVEAILKNMKILGAL